MGHTLHGIFYRVPALTCTRIESNMTTSPTACVLDLQLCGGVWGCVGVCGGVWGCVGVCGGVWGWVCGGVWGWVWGGVWGCVGVGVWGVWGCVWVCGGVWGCVGVHSANAHQKKKVDCPCYSETFRNDSEEGDLLFRNHATLCCHQCPQQWLVVSPSRHVGVALLALPANTYLLMPQNETYAFNAFLVCVLGMRGSFQVSSVSSTSAASAASGRECACKCPTQVKRSEAS